MREKDNSDTISYAFRTYCTSDQPAILYSPKGNSAFSKQIAAAANGMHRSVVVTLWIVSIASVYADRHVECHSNVDCDYSGCSNR